MMKRSILALLAFTALTAPAIAQSLSSVDVSSELVTSKWPGSTTSRSLADRFTDKIDVRDFGAACDGSTDDTAAFQRAVNAGLKSSGGGATIRIPSSHCRLDGVVGYGGANTWEWEAGANTSGSGGGVMGIASQGEVWGTTGHGYGAVGADNGINTTLYASLLSMPTTGGEYQKNAFFASTVQNDVSTASVSKGTVGIYSTADVASNNPWGYVWSGVFIATLDQKSNGYATGMAVGVQNYSGQAVDMMAKGTTIGETITSSGNANTSAALVVLASNSQFLNGLVVYQDSVVSDAFELRTPGGVEIAAVRKDGTEVSQKQMIGPSSLGAIMKLPVQAVSPASGTVVLTSDGTAPNGTNCTALPSNSAATFNATLVAREPATGQAASFSINGGLFTRVSTLSASSYRGPGSSGVAATYMSGSDAGSLGVSVGFDQSTGCAVVTASSRSGHTWNWKGYIELSAEVQ